MIKKLLLNNWFLSYSSPKITIYFVSNDKFFSNYFIKNFHIEYSFNIIEHNHSDTFLPEINLVKSNNKNYFFIILDHSFENNESFDFKLGIDISNDIIKIQPKWDILLLTPPNYNHPLLPPNITPIIRTDNAYQRIQNIILTICNEKTIQLQKKSNTLFFIILSFCILTIIGFLIYFITYKL